jgi:hypothetical protein
MGYNRQLWEQIVYITESGSFDYYNARILCLLCPIIALIMIASTIPVYKLA